MKTYIAVSRDGGTEFFSAYSYSDAYQQATDWSEQHGGLLTMDEQQ